MLTLHGARSYAALCKAPPFQACSRPPGRRLKQQARPCRAHFRDDEKTLASSISVIENVMKSVTEEVFVYATKACSSGEDLPVGIKQHLMQRHLHEYLPNLDENFLSVLLEYIECSKVDGKPTEVTDLLMVMRGAVLGQLSEHLQPDLQILTQLSHCQTREDRQAILREAMANRDHQGQAAGGESDAAPEEKSRTFSLLDVARACARVIDHMEGTPKVVDRVLLARMCIIHLDLEEESKNVQTTWEGTGELPSPFFFHPDAVFLKLEVVPPATMAFLKELVKQHNPTIRQGILVRAFETGWNGQTGWTPEGDGSNDIKPGKFLHALGATTSKLYAGQASPGFGKASPELMQRLDDVRRDVEKALGTVAKVAS